MLVAMLCKTTFYVAVGLIKLSIALFTRRMAYRLSKWWTILCDVFIASLVVYMLLAIFYNVFACNPPAIQWDLELRGRHEPMPTCIDIIIQSQILSGIHVAQGLTLLSTPIVILWRVQISPAKKIRLFMIWTVGGVTVLGGLLRQIRPTMTNDFTWDYVEVLVWTCLDLSLGIITASLPVLDGLFEKYWRQAASSLSNAYGNSSHGATSNSTGQYGRPQTDKSRKQTSTVSTTQINGRSESRESIFGHNDEDVPYEMNIIRTQEVELHFTNSIDDEERGSASRNAKLTSAYYNRPEWQERSRAK